MILLNEYSKSYNIEIFIYLHPIELKKSNLSLTKNYYSKIIRNKNIKISFDNTPSIFSFNQIDLGISIKSTLMFERRKMRIDCELLRVIDLSKQYA